MNNKKNNAKIKKDSKPRIQCKWCGKEKLQYNFFKCSIDRNVNICTKCINNKYNEVLSQSNKAKAILACCHYLDIAFIYDIFNNLELDEGIGIYIRQFNLRQNQQSDNFEQGLIKYFDLNIIPNEETKDRAKDRLTEIITQLEEIRNDIR
ncbi:MAG: hypothetical protein J6A19_05625 [Oscillospiraceae bacterium]|nr:hypothetical protein [Oscillospiraceae bacterium]